MAIQDWIFRLVLLTMAWTLTPGLARGEEPWLLRAPAGERYAELNPKGQTILPNGRLLTPVGAMVRVEPHPYGLTASPDGRWVVTTNSDDGLTILDLSDVAAPVVNLIQDHRGQEAQVLPAAFMGLAVDAKSEVVYVAGAHDWSLMAFSLASRERLFRISCAHETAEGKFDTGFLGDLRLSRDGKRVYAVDQANFRFLTINVEERKVENSIAVGRHPFGVALSPDESRAYVANVGMYEYQRYRDAQGHVAKLDFPPVGMPSEEAEQGTEVEGVTVPGLGDPNDIRAMSVWTIDISEPGQERVIAKAKTGHLVGEKLEDFPAVGGSSPNSIVATEDSVYVSNGSNDSLTVIDAKSGDRARDIDIRLEGELGRWRGIIPFGLCLSRDGRRLFVAEAGINAVGVMEVKSGRMTGHIPTGWFPSKLALSPDGKRLFVANAKGLGSGPSDGPGHAPGDPTGVGDLMRGYVEVVDLEAALAQLEALTKQVVKNNVEKVPATADPRAKGHPVPPFAHAWESPIKHVIYVTKENRTYDEIFGALPGGRGDAELCRLGRPITVANKNGSLKVENVVLMPNHVALAKRFAVSDNFYCDSDHSADGHRWLVGTYPNEFMEARLDLESRGPGPGGLLFTGSSGAIYPEDYNEAGSIWEHFERNKLSFFNFGLGFEFAPGDESQEDKYTGIKLSVNYPMPEALRENTSRTFATYNTNVPDQFRMDMFEKHFRERWLSGREVFPPVVTMMLPNDHGAGERPDDGYPFWGSYMADNDLALGRLVELISHSPFWKETVIIVTEDDAQGYRDTVDAHRSICMVIGPYAKRTHVSHTHVSIASILKTVFLIHGLPPLNQYDAFASDLADLFAQEAANAEPYDAIASDPRVFDPKKALDPLKAEFKWRQTAGPEDVDNQAYLDSDEYGHAGAAGHEARERN
jgi:YVTN family beta-propeller protein